MSDDFKPCETALASQRALLLEFLKKHKEGTTLTFRDVLGICHPAGRICELRKKGWGIETHKGWAYDAQGRRHTNAIYVLTGEPSHD